MIRKLTRIALTGLLSTLLLLAGCDSDKPSTPDTAKTPDKLSARLKWLPGATYIGTIAGKQAGYFKQQNIDLEIFPGGFEADPIKLVAAGSNDFGITGAEQLLQARANGVPVRAIFMELQYSPAGWMTLESSGIKTPHDFVGKKVGAQYGTNIEPTLDALLARLGIDPAKLTRVPVKYDVAPLFTGQVDVLPVYLTGQPVQARMEGKKVNTIDPKDYGIRLYGNVYFTSEKMIEEHPDQVQRFVNALSQGWQLALDNPQKAIELLVAAEPMLKPKYELAYLKETLPFVRVAKGKPLGYMDRKRWIETRDIMSRYADLPADVDIDAAYTNAFVEKAQEITR